MARGAEVDELTSSVMSTSAYSMRMGFAMASGSVEASKDSKAVVTSLTIHISLVSQTF